MDLNLRDKGTLVEGLWHAVDDAANNLEAVPRSIKRVIETEAWREREHRGRVFKHKTFLDFITTKPLAGCGWPPEKVEALLKDEPEVLALWRKATTGKPGAHNNNVIRNRQGNSRAYALDRLKRERPDLFNKVIAKEMSANAAANEAGFRKPPSPLKQLRKAWKVATPDERGEFLAEISAGTRADRNEPEQPVDGPARANIARGLQGQTPDR
jgi:hypothetical protein